MTGRRAVVLQPRLRPLGGAEGVAAWAIQALAADHQVLLVSREAPDLGAIDRRYGTQLVRADLRVVAVRSSLEQVALRLDNLRDWLLQRHARRLARGAQVAVALDNEADLGPGAVQYLHSPKLVFQPRGGRDLGPYHANGLVGAAYLSASALLTGFSPRRMRRNRTLVCSDWVGEHVRRVHGIEALTLYPPAAGDFPEVAWEHKREGVVWAGRLWPDKRVELVIDIVERVRRRGCALSLHLLGAVHDRAYAERIRALVRERAAWVRLDEDVDRAELAQVMARYRYGLHGTAEEWFGMAPAELVRAGAIVFVPRGGGQVEIVGKDPRLLFENAEQAAAKIAATAASPELQATLREQLSSLRARFSTERFVQDFRKLCIEPAARPPSAAPH